MTEENKQGDNGKLEAEKQKEQKPVNEVRLIIIKNIESGRLDVLGPGNGQLYDEPLCWWLLEKAKRFIEAHNARENQSNIIKSNPSMAQQIRGMFHKK